MHYEELSDFEINKAVAIALGHKCYYDNGSFTNGLMGSSVVVKGNGIIGSVNFVNSWADAGPIIERYRLYLDPIFISDWCVTTECDTYRAINKNPLRAAMIVFLIINEEQEESE